MLRFWMMLFVLVVPGMGFAADLGEGQVSIGNADVLRGSFVEERHLAGFKTPMRSAGHFVVAPAHGLIWDIQKPFPTTTVMTPTGLVQMIGGVVMAHLPTQKIPFLLHLYNMLGGALAGNWKPLEAEFIVARTTIADGWQVMLSPRAMDNPVMPFSSIIVRGHQFVEDVTLVKPDGDFDELTFHDEVLSQAPLTATEKAAFEAIHP